MGEHYVSRPREKALTPEQETLVRRLIQSGYSTTQIFRAVGHRSASQLYRFADANGLRDKLRENGMIRKTTIGRAKPWKK